jgi:hypothetical protein
MENRTKKLPRWVIVLTALCGLIGACNARKTAPASDGGGGVN